MRLLSVCFLIFINYQKIVWASEPASGAGAQSDKKEEKTYSGSQSDEWQQVLKEYSTAKVKFENELKALEILKSKFKESEGNLSLQEIEEIKKQTKVVKDAEENYKRYQTQYYMRFPEKGLEKGRTYKRKGVEDVDGVDEKPQTIDQKVKNLNKKIGSQYGVKSKPAKSKLLNDDRQKSLINKEGLDSYQNDGVTEKIKLEK